MTMLTMGFELVVHHDQCNKKEGKEEINQDHRFPDCWLTFCLSPLKLKYYKKLETVHFFVNVQTEGDQIIILSTILS